MDHADPAPRDRQLSAMGWMPAVVVTRAKPPSGPPLPGAVLSHDVPPIHAGRMAASIAAALIW
jgi:hypothetical protein